MKICYGKNAIKTPRSSLEVTDSGLELTISPLLLTDEGDYRYTFIHNSIVKIDR